MWIPSEHSNDENVRWAWLRAVEWDGWPNFISQPLVPVLFYFYPWALVLIWLSLVALLWRVLVVPYWISPGLADAGPLLVRLRFVTAPAMAYLLWKEDHAPLAVAALIWPLLGPLVTSFLLSVFTALMNLTVLPVVMLLKHFRIQAPAGQFVAMQVRTGQIGVIQRRLLVAIGFEPKEPISPGGSHG